jgi:hypothetical protein
MAILVVIHPLLRRLYDFLRPISSAGNSKSKPDNGTPQFVSTEMADARLEQRVTFDLGFSLLFLCALHGFSALKVLVILYMNYSIATKLPRQYLPVATWTFNIGILFANELCQGYKYADIARVLSWSVSTFSSAKASAQTVNWDSPLDHYGGLIPRWEILFNISVLRLISFNMDYYWSYDQRGGNAVEVGPITTLSEVMC